MQTSRFDRRIAFKLAISVLVASLLAMTLWMPRRELPFHLRMEAGSGVVQSRPGLPLPAGLRAGDRVVPAQQTVRMRAVLVSENIPGDAAHTLLVQRAGVLLPVTVRSTPVPRPARASTEALLQALANGMILALGLLTLWRGRGWAAWGLATFALSVLLGGALVALPAPPYANVVLQAVMQWLSGPMAFVGLFLTAQALVGWQPGLRLRWGRPYGLILLTLYALELAATLAFILAGIGSLPEVLQAVLAGLGLMALGAPLLLLLRGYYGATAEARLRIRWILFGTVLLLPLLLINMMQQSDALRHSPAWVWVRWLHPLLIIGVLGFYTYAVLRRRLVEVRVVLNRALVFALLMGVVVGFFALTESLIERSALGARAGLALEIGVPLALGVLFHQLHRRIEAVVDRVFFHREHRARAELRAFVRDAGFIESPEVLVQRAAETFGRCAGGRGAALYEAHARGFRQSARAGVDLPAVLDQDDRALVRLRATLMPQDLHGLDSTLGEGGLALPLALRGHLFGVLVCGPLAAGQHAQADVENLAQAAHEVGASLFALRARANENLVAALACGVVPPTQAVQRARELAGPA